MSAALSPNGLLPVAMLGSDYYSGGFKHLPVTTNNTAAIAKGTPVALVNGSVVALSTSPTTTANPSIGVFMGCKYVDAQGRPTWSDLLPANAVTGGNLEIRAFVNDNPDQVYEVQADGPIAANSIGSNANLKNFGSDDVVNKVSKVQLDSASLDKASNSTKGFRIVGFSPKVDNAAADAFTKVIVKFNTGAHSYHNGGTA